MSPDLPAWVLSIGAILWPAYRMARRAYATHRTSAHLDCLRRIAVLEYELGLVEPVLTAQRLVDPGSDVRTDARPQVNERLIVLSEKGVVPAFKRRNTVHKCEPADPLGRDWPIRK